MKRIITLLAVVFIATTSAFAQSAHEHIMADINRAGGVYYSYPTPTEKYTPAPKGYEPFYISHYGRHGSRYMLTDYMYNFPVDVLNKAHANGKLTEFGEDVRRRVLEVQAASHRRAGELTQKGLHQHEQIATRMAQNFPELFKQKGLKVDVLSSVIPRCLMSMSAFCDALKSQNPTLQITRDSSNSKMDQIHNLRPAWNPDVPDDVINIIMGDNTFWRKKVLEYDKKYIDHLRVLNKIFNDQEYISNSVKGVDFWRYLAELVVSIQCLDIDINLNDVFTADELYEHWRTDNFGHYAKYGRYVYYPLMTQVTRKMLFAIIEQIDKDLAAGTPSVSLRFGHDTGIFCISPLMGLPGSCVSTSDYDKINDEWRDYLIAPMAANLQMIFYLKKGCDEPLVRFMHNENEVHFPIECSTAPYYPWSQLKAFWHQHIASIL